MSMSSNFTFKEKYKNNYQNFQKNVSMATVTVEAFISKSFKYLKTLSLKLGYIIDVILAEAMKLNDDITKMCLNKC